MMKKHPLFAATRNNYLRKCFLILRLSDERRRASTAAMNAQPPSRIATHHDDEKQDI
jgi:hypothetical protein